MKPIPSLPNYYVTPELRIVGPYNRPLYQGKDKDGYLIVMPRIDKKRVVRKVHRLVCEAFHGQPPEGKNCALHNDGVKTNNHPTNLRWGSQKDNKDDCMKHFKDSGIQYAHWNQGNKHSLSKLTPEKVRFILETCTPSAKKGAKSSAARMLGVSPSLITGVIKKERWKHLLVNKQNLKDKEATNE